MRTNQEFLGLGQTSIVLSSEEKRWEIVNRTDPTTILAYMKGEESEVPGFPLGRQAWHFLDVNCTDSALTTTRSRLLQFFTPVLSSHKTQLKP